MNTASLTLLLLLCPVAWAQGPQNSDFGFSLGASSFPRVAVQATSTQPAGFAPGFVRWNLQTSYAHQVHSAAIGNLFVEMPITFAGKDTPLVLRSNTYFTPGIRLKIPTRTRISFYAALGGGMVINGEKDTLVNGQLTARTDPTVASLAADFGGGIDLRLSRLFSLRVEGRDFITPAGLGGTLGHNHAVFLAGIAVHI
jgi:hypothetical protein